jgi:hypothetical protein
LWVVLGKWAACEVLQRCSAERLPLPRRVGAPESGLYDRHLTMVDRYLAHLSKDRADGSTIESQLDMDIYHGVLATEETERDELVVEMAWWQ